MQDAKRLGASSPGYWFDESHEFLSSDLRPWLDVINKAAADYSLPWRYVIGCDADGSFEITLPTSNVSSSNERSKPVGLTRDYKYTDSDGDSIEVDKPNNDPEGTIAHVVTTGDDGTGFYVTAESVVPLALNVLGHDRPTLGERRYPGDWQSLGPVVRGEDHRDELLAEAAANLRAIDLYDQHAAKRQADEEAAKADARAAIETANARQSKLEELRRVRNEANEALHAAARQLGDVGIYDISMAELTEAIEARNEAQGALTAFIDAA